MKPLSEQLLAHYQQSVQTITRCVRIERQDGGVLGLTEHDQDLWFEGVCYQSAAGYRSTALQTSPHLAVGTVEIEGILNAAGVDQQAILAGLFDEARIEVFEVNYEDLSQGRLLLMCGYWGEAHLQVGRYVTEFRSLAERLQQPIGELYSASCRAQLGDARCGVALTAFTHRAVVTEKVSDTEFIAVDLTQAEDYFQYGTLRWERDAHINRLSRIKSFQVGGRCLLWDAPSYPIAVGDAFSATAGCNKAVSTCSGRFKNTVNFRGEPFVPGQDKVSQYPDLK